MKLQRPSLVLLLSAALLAGGVALYETQKNPNSSSSDVDQSASQKVFNFSEDAIAVLTIATARSATAPDSSPPPSPAPQAPIVALRKIDGQWQLSAPLKVPADESTVLFLTNLLTTAQRDRTLAVSRDRAAEFGLDNPLATIDITLTDQQKHKLVLGKPSFDRTVLYAAIDPNPEEEQLTVALVSPQFANAVNRELQEWQAVKDENPADAAPGKL
ncbi:MAG: DUF4340 domain-containing protein [Alkalinema sp. RL_2_19]|nr:DUF4340 domain-containing protein [Alkalinema sp. RL_2_19]